MEQGTKGKKGQWKQWLAMGFFLLLGAACGVLIGKYLVTLRESGRSGSSVLLSFLALFAGMYAALFLQIIIHEGGHLLFGLLTGYSFSSFRIGNLMWMKEGEKLRFKRMSLAGTGGQCLMIPPEWKNGRIPYVLYNLGGVISNLIFAGIFLGFSVICQESAWSVFWMIFAGVGIAYAMMNGIPMRLGDVDNDGYNAWSLGKNPRALYSLWVQMKANEQMARGKQLRELPKEWFSFPEPEEMKNSMVATLGVFACNRLMDEHRFEEAAREMERILHMDTAIVGIHRNLLLCDCIYCELLGECRGEVMEKLYDRQLQKFMKSMKRYPSVLRTQYAYALLYEKDSEKAAGYEKQFEKVARTYPYEGDLKSEREFITIIQEKASLAPREE